MNTYSIRVLAALGMPLVVTACSSGANTGAEGALNSGSEPQFV